MSAKGRLVTYWVMTGLVAFFIGGGGLSQVVRAVQTPHAVVPELEYPMYFFGILGVWKVLGAVAILWPGFGLLKEWAYAGIVFDLTGAVASMVAVGKYGAYGFHVVAPLVIAGMAVVSWGLRPDGRRVSGVRAWGLGAA